MLVSIQSVIQSLRQCKVEESLMYDVIMPMVGEQETREEDLLRIRQKNRRDKMKSLIRGEDPAPIGDYNYPGIAEVKAPSYAKRS